MKKITFIAIITVVIFTFFSACNSEEKENAKQLVKMQMVYEDNPAFFSKDMKLVWGEKSYYVSNELDAERGKEIGYSVDEYSEWRIYERKGYESDYLIAVENGNDEVWQIMSTHPPEKPWRQYILENATEQQRLERMLSVTLYSDKSAVLATPPISSYLMVGNYYYSIENDELLIFQVKDNPIAIFTVSSDHTIIFKSATVSLFADVGAKYVCK